jgi:hypothetical protein
MQPGEIIFSSFFKWIGLFAMFDTSDSIYHKGATGKQSHHLKDKNTKTFGKL